MYVISLRNQYWGLWRHVSFTVGIQNGTLSLSLNFHDQNHSSDAVFQCRYTEVYSINQFT